MKRDRDRPREGRRRVASRRAGTAHPSPLDWPIERSKSGPERALDQRAPGMVRRAPLQPRT
jgi:hypothetical protein